MRISDWSSDVCSSDLEWRRVSSRGLSGRDLGRAIGVVPQDRGALLARVNTWVNHEIAYRNDRQLFGTSDYWADAATTLARKTGDCEDFAILKMQMLAGAGVDSNEDRKSTRLNSSH